MFHSVFPYIQYFTRIIDNYIMYDLQNAEFMVPYLPTYPSLNIPHATLWEGQLHHLYIYISFIFAVTCYRSYLGSCNVKIKSKNLHK